jgi:hypothetical protein
VPGEDLQGLQQVALAILVERLGEEGEGSSSQHVPDDAGLYKRQGVSCEEEGTET